jgi:hypothetical protein
MDLCCAAYVGLPFLLLGTNAEFAIRPSDVCTTANNCDIKGYNTSKHYRGCAFSRSETVDSAVRNRDDGSLFRELEQIVDARGGREDSLATSSCSEGEEGRNILRILTEP